MNSFISEINIYPVKSLKAVSLTSAHVQHRGLQYDRRWMIVDAEGKFLTQREFSRMALISAVVDGDQLTISGPGMPPISLPAAPSGGQLMSVRVWRSTCEAFVVSEQANEILSSVLDVPCRLVYMPDETRRDVNPDFAAGEGIVSFADGYPILMVGQSSLADLNARLESPVPMNRFRPNLIISGSDAFTEDNWKTIRIGGITLKLVKPCDRCVITTIDQSAGERFGVEPLQTLAQYRLRNQKVVFGMFTIPLGEGVVRVGDGVEVLE